MRGDGKKSGGDRIFRVIWEDFHKSEIRSKIRQELNEIYEFYLDRATKEKLESMGRIKRWFARNLFILKSLILKLSPARRVLLVISLIFVLGGFRISHNSYSLEFKVVGYIILLLILTLELKDKLLAKYELEAGRVVQNALIPQSCPELSGWEIWLFNRPANEVGGDLVDYIAEDDGRLCLILADVAGKGLGAALFMAKLQATVRAIAPGLKSLSRLGQKLNEIFCRDGMPTRFISFICIEILRDSDNLRILNAGHIPPVVLDEGEIEFLDKGGPALGLIPGSSFFEQRIRVKEGGMILVYSDGLTEARDANGKLFGEERLFKIFSKMNTLSAIEAGESLVSEVEKHRGDAAQSDDLSMILLKRSCRISLK